MKLLFGIVACVAALTVSSQAAKIEGKAAKLPGNNYALVSDVKTVSLKVTKTKKGGSVTITATGTVPTGGWTSPELSPYIYIVAPPDGIYSFSFIAKKPTGIVDQMVHTIVVKRVWDNFPAGLKGVRVVAKNNSVVEKLKH